MTQAQRSVTLHSHTLYAKCFVGPGVCWGSKVVSIWLNWLGLMMMIKMRKLKPRSLFFVMKHKGWRNSREPRKPNQNNSISG